jgi:ribosomal protein S18 acetylase RimI-like enzyme
MRSESIQDTSAGAYEISADPGRLNLDVIHGFLTEAYWSKGIPREVVAKAMQHSLCYGVYRGAQQVGYARVVTDFAVMAHLCDVFVLPDHRGLGLARKLVAFLLADPRLVQIRRWSLSTADMHKFYAGFGFTPPPDPNAQMVRRPA